MWEFVYSVSIALYLVGNYVEWRDGILTLAHDASSLWLWLSSRRQMSGGRGGASFSSSRVLPDHHHHHHHNSTATWTPPGPSEMKRRTRALFALGPVAALPYRTYQGTQVHRHLRYVTGLPPPPPPPPPPPEALVSMSLHTPLSFARVVRDFVALKCGENSAASAAAGGHGHRFFVFHPDTAWVGAFQRLHDVEGPLPPEFAGVAHNLFVLARWMLCERVALVQALGDAAGRRVRFHVLVPTTETLVVPQRFCLVEALLPLTIEGPISKGHPLVWFAVAVAGSSTAAPILRDVGAIPPPRPDVAEGKAFVAMCLLWIAASPLLLAVCKMLCFAQLPFYVALAVSLLFHGFALNLTLWLKRHVCDYHLREDASMMLG